MNSQGMQSVVSIPTNGQIWFGTPPVDLQHIFAFFQFVATGNHLFPTLGKRQNDYDNVSLKNFRRTTQKSRRVACVLSVIVFDI